jgi:hypothetical protein
MYGIGYLLAFLAAVAVGWVVPIVGVALVLPMLQVVFVLNQWVAIALMVLSGASLMWYAVKKLELWQNIIWGALWTSGVVCAWLGVFHWYALIVSLIVLIILLIPGIVVRGWVDILRWYAIGELLLTLTFLFGQRAHIPGTIVVSAILLLALACLISAGVYRPFEVRRMKRRLATIATLTAILLFFWQPIIKPTFQWIASAAQRLF